LTNEGDIDLNKLIMNFKYLENLTRVIEGVISAYNIDFAWIGIKKEDYSVHPIASVGFEQSYLESLTVKWDDSKYGNSPEGKSLKEGKTVLLNDIAHPSYKSLLNFTEKYGFKSLASIPLKIDDNILGSFNIYSKQKNYFSSNLLDKISLFSSSLSHIIYNTIVKEPQIDEKLKEYIELFYDITLNINKGIMSELNINYLILDALSIIEKLLMADGSEFVIYNRTSHKTELNIPSKLWIKNFRKSSSDEIFHGITPALDYLLNESKPFSYNYTSFSQAIPFYQKKGLASIGGASAKAYVYDRQYEAVLVFGRKYNRLFKESELSLFKLLSQLFFSSYAFDKYMSNITSLSKDIDLLSRIDILTKTYNKESFMLLLKEEINRYKIQNENFTIGIIDIDNFSNINNTYGYSIGDIIIKKVSEFLNESLSKFGIIARLGGDEFGLIMPNTKTEPAYKILTGLISDLSEKKFNLENISLNLGITAGIAEYPKDAALQDELLSVADNALHFAKEEGKRIVGYKEIAKDYIIMSSKTELIYKAIESDLFLPAFQPIRNINSLSIYGYESLARIKMNGAVYSAYEFIETIEKLNLINKVDRILMEKAFDIFKSLDNQGTNNAKLFYNIHPSIFKNSKSVKELKKLIRKFSMEGRLLLEITERETLPNLEEFSRFVKIMEEDGIFFVIDDFGSGYSSLTYLKHLTSTPIIKIDGSFIKNCHKNKRDARLIEGISSLAKNIDIIPLAEFVESREVLLELKNRGIELIQGYFVGEPSFEPSPI
jgi:diguanylate cyclase (GGDEF)-like protein